MSTTIRRNATKRISDILNNCEFLRVFKYDDMGDDNKEVTAADVIAAGQQYEFDRVYVDESGCIHCVINRNLSYTGYPTLELARDKMTAPAVAKYRIEERIAARKPNCEISRRIMAKITDGATVPEALDSVIGSGTFDRIASEVYEAFQEPEEESVDVAKIILQQLGGARFRLMTGAKNFIAIENGLQFKLPSTSHFVRDGINSVRIVLNGNDLYNIQFHKIRGTSVKLIADLSDIFCEDLQEVFTKYTGLNTHL